MIGDTTLAMLHVPIFFCLFDHLHERSCKNEEASSSEGDTHDIEETLDDTAAEKKKDK